jgi:hypothetical protein
MSVIFVKPREGGRVRMPDRNFRPMKATGEWVPTIDYYNRLVLVGDLIETDPPPPDAPAAEVSSTTQPATEATSNAATPTA